MAPVPFLIIVVLSLIMTTSATVSNQELEAALYTLRSRGYTLFPNAITTTDLRPLLLSQNSTFTLFSPPDPFLFSLDLSSTASHYIYCLLLHVSPLRSSLSQLRSIKGPVYLDTLLPSHRLSIDRSLVLENGTIVETVLIDGVRVSVPDLFLGSSIAVHGLEGLLVSTFGEEEAANADRTPARSPVLSPAGWSVVPASSPPETWRRETAEHLGDYESDIGKRKLHRSGYAGDYDGETAHAVFGKFHRGIVR